ncbi:MAG: hypothetical protein II135_07175 [Clostridia bacterium]|nr:hypothetical protein [Clostridia bacterium]
MKRNLLGNIAGTAFLALFGAVYELFSHGVYSYFMIYAFAVPLIFGVLPYTLLLISRKVPGRAALNLWNSGIAAISVGCVFRGVLEIYGTTNSFSVIYPVSGLLLLTAGLITGIVGLKRKQNNGIITQAEYDALSEAIEE